MAATAKAVESRERPIIFSGPMVRAIFEGRKTQTRRIVRGHTPDCQLIGYAKDSNCAYWKYPNGNQGYNQCPYGKIGDRLWVRETWFKHEDDPVIYRSELTPDQLQDEAIVRRAAKIDSEFRWRSPIHMPRWASQLTLEITDIRVERVQSISEADATAEGMEWDGRGETLYPVNRFALGWNKLNAKRGYSWESNPWVWVISFQRVDSENNERGTPR